MTTFTVRGTRNGSLVHVTWSDCALSGDPPTVDLVRTQAEIVTTLHDDGRAARAFPDLGALPAEPLAVPEAAHSLICHVIDTVRGTAGDVPSR